MNTRRNHMLMRPEGTEQRAPWRRFLPFALAAGTAVLVLPLVGFDPMFSIALLLSCVLIVID